jgi:hypothetical protein
VLGDQVQTAIPEFNDAIADATPEHAPYLLRGLIPVYLHERSG